MSSLVITPADEQKLRELASGIAKDIEDVHTLLGRAGWSMADYEELCSTRSFKLMLDEAYSEWQGANNTPKRVKLKAAINIEQALPSLYNAMINPQEALSSRVKVFEVMARIGGLGNPEPANMGGGSAFNLTIQLEGSGAKEITINASPALPSFPARHPQSDLLKGMPLEEF